MRTNNLNLNGVDISALKHEAEFYGLEPLVKKLALCEEELYGGCGDLLFHSYISPSDFGEDEVSGANTLVLNSELLQAASNGVNSNPDPTHIVKPVTLITCHKNWMVAVHVDYLSAFILRDPGDWNLIWQSGALARTIDRVALATTSSYIGGHVIPGGGMAGAPGVQASSTSQVIVQSQAPLDRGAISVQNSAHNSGAYGLPATPPSTQSQQLPNQSQHPGNWRSGQSPGSVQSPGSGSSMAAVPAFNSSPGVTGCMVAAAAGSTVWLWHIYPKYDDETGLDTLIVALHSPPPCNSSDFRTSRLSRSKEIWKTDLVGLFDLNRRAVDYLLFISTHLVALSRHGLVGVRHMMTNTWQVWSTVPILSYGVDGSELLLLGSANGRISSINIQKFPLRIVDNDLLVTEIYRDRYRDPITALSIYLIPRKLRSNRNSWEIAYGTFSGRVCIIFHHPETFSMSPRLFQTFNVHRSMVTKVVLSTRHLISVCNELHHVRTWNVTRFRGLISTQPNATPLASFHVTTLDETEPQELVDSVLNAVILCNNQQQKHKKSDKSDCRPDLFRNPNTNSVHLGRSNSAAAPQANLDFRRINIQFPPRRQPPKDLPVTVPLSTVPNLGTCDQHPLASLSRGHFQSPGDSTSSPLSNSVSPNELLPSSSLVEPNLNPYNLSTFAQLSDSGMAAISNSISRQVSSDLVLTSESLRESALLPRTSWLHEDPGTPSSRTSFLGFNSCSTGQDLPRDSHTAQSYQQTVSATRHQPTSGCSTEAPQNTSRSSWSTGPGTIQGQLSLRGQRTQQSIGPRSIFIRPIDSTEVQDLSLLELRDNGAGQAGNKNRRTRRRQVVDLHKYANDPGPYGDKDDELVFIQKMTPNANQLLVRLASSGRRVCLIRSVDGVPIKSFCVHVNDGVRMATAHPRRYVFTGHENGAIQIWDLTTALSLPRNPFAANQFRSGIHGYPFQNQEFSQLSSSEADIPICFQRMYTCLGYPVNPTPAPSPTYTTTLIAPPTSATDSSSSILTCPGDFSGPSSAIPCLGGPTPKEILRLLENCQFGDKLIESPELIASIDSCMCLCNEDNQGHLLEQTSE